MSVEFGFISSAAYYHKYQNVLLEKLDESLDSSVNFTCKVNPESLIIQEDIIQIGSDLKFNLDPCFAKLNFTCSVDPDSYIKTYKVNNKILFQCRYNPTNFIIIYNNMIPTITKWTFVDH